MSVTEEPARELSTSGSSLFRCLCLVVDVSGIEEIQVLDDGDRTIYTETPLVPSVQRTEEVR